MSSNRGEEDKIERWGGGLMSCATSIFEGLDDIETAIIPRRMMVGATETARFKCGLHWGAL